MISKFLFFVIFFVTSSLCAQTVVVNSNLTKIDASSHVGLYKDTTSRLQINDIIRVKKDELKRFDISRVNFDHSGVYWFWLDVENSSDKALQWVYSSPRVNGYNTELFIVHGNDMIERVSLRDAYSYLNHPTISNFITSQPGEKKSVVLKVDYDNNGFLYPQFDIYSNDDFIAHSSTRILSKSIALGAIIGLFFYNLFLLLSFRSSVYGWYCTYLAGVVFYLIGNNGIGYQFFWGGYEFALSNIFSATYPLMFAAALQFSKEFLKLNKRLPIVAMLMDMLSVFFVFLLLLYFIGYIDNTAKLFSLVSFILAFLPLLGGYVWYLGYKEARMYVLAWSAWSICTIPIVLAVSGVNLDYDFITASSRFGLLLEATLLSLALADQINILRRERNEAKEELEAQRSAMEVSSRLAQMGEMISAISHQWKQPLNVITLHSQDIKITLLERKIEVPSEVYIGLDKLKEVVTHMSQTLDDFKNFFSPSKIKRNFSPINMVHTVLNMVGRQYEHAMMKFDIQGDETLKVLGRENELKQVVLNIFNNSRDAFYSNNIEDRRVNLSVQKIDEKIQIQISDNAGGIPKEIIAKIFDQYITTKGDDGTGIGLYLCRRIVVDSFGGEIEVHNIKNGTMFTITLPLSDAITL